MEKLIAEEYNASENSSNIYLNNDDGNDNYKVINKRDSTSFTSVKDFFQTVFLPDGYPHSVSDDYIDYQIWDSVQAFASGITGTLATHAVLKSIGVGDAQATPLAATLIWLMKDGTGMIGRIVFAYFKGSELDANCKRWRLFADVLNDFAIAVDIVSPYFQTFSVILQCISSLSRSLVGITGSSTRAALTQHQARRNNLADVSAKDGSQETLINLTALIVSLTIIPYVVLNENVTLVMFIALTCLHIYANYKAVTSVHIELFNLDRLTSVVEHYLRTGQLLSVKEANEREKVWPFQSDRTKSYPLKIGLALYEHNLNAQLKQSLLFAKQSEINYLLTISNGNDDKNGKNLIKISLFQNDEDEVKNIFMAVFNSILLHFLLAEKYIKVNNTQIDDLRKLINETIERENDEIIKHSIKFTKQNFNDFYQKSINKGWQMKQHLLPSGEWRVKF